MHWCNDESMMVMSSIPFVGYYFRRIQLWWRSKFGKTKTQFQCSSSPTGEHKYEWGGRYLIPARSIQSRSRMDTSLKCHYCDHMIGPQKGRSAIEEAK